MLGFTDGYWQQVSGETQHFTANLIEMNPFNPTYAKLSNSGYYRNQGVSSNRGEATRTGCLSAKESPFEWPRPYTAPDYWGKTCGTFPLCPGDLAPLR